MWSIHPSQLNCCSSTNPELDSWSCWASSRHASLSYSKNPSASSGPVGRGPSALENRTSPQPVYAHSHSPSELFITRPHWSCTLTSTSPTTTHQLSSPMRGRELASHSSLTHWQSFLPCFRSRGRSATPLRLKHFFHSQIHQSVH